MPEFGWKGVGDSPLTGITRNPMGIFREQAADPLPELQLQPCSAWASCIWGPMAPDQSESLQVFVGSWVSNPPTARFHLTPCSANGGGLAHLGPLARTVSEAALMLSIIGRPDHRDPTAWNEIPPAYHEGLDKGAEGLRVGYSVDLGYADHLDPEVISAVRRAADRLRAHGAFVEEVNPELDDPSDVLATLWEAGAALILRTFSKEDRSRCDPGMARVGQSEEKKSTVRALSRR